MNKAGNHWFLFGLLLKGSTNKPKAGAILAVWLGLMVLFAAIYSAGPENLAVLGSIPTKYVWVVAVFYCLLVFYRTRQKAKRFALAYCQALQNEQPDELVELFQPHSTVAQTAVVAAVAAHERAAAYALYGQEDRAREALQSVDWSVLPPLIQAGALGAEGLVTLLCRGNADEALRVFQRAQELSSISGMVPGAAQTKKSYEVFVAVCESHLGYLSEPGLQRMREALLDARYPVLQLLSAWGLAIWSEHDEHTKTEEYREFIGKLAPHCEVFRMGREDLLKAKEGKVDREKTSIVQEISTEQSEKWKDAAKGLLRRKLLKTAAMWGLLIVMFWLIWLFVSPRK